MDELLTVEELANILKLKTKTIYKMNDQGKIPKAKKIGGALRWSKKEVEAWLLSL